jgi:hypothetical protein
METACDIITACCVLQNFCILFGDSGEEFIDDVENQELDVYNDQPLNDVDGIAKRQDSYKFAKKLKPMDNLVTNKIADLNFI